MCGSRHIALLVSAVFLSAYCSAGDSAGPQAAVQPLPADVSDSVALGMVVVTGTRTPKTLKDVPIVTRVITSAEIEKRNAADIK